MRNGARGAVWMLSVLAVGAACAGAGDDGATDTAAAASQSRDSAGVTIVESSRPAWAEGEGWRVDEEPRLTIGGAAADPDQQLWRVRGAVTLSSGDIVIANAGTNELRWYDASGRLLQRAGGAGGGPGEFQMMSAFLTAGGDSVAVGDIQQGRISLFDPEGAFVRSRPLTDGLMLTPVTRFDDGAFLLMTWGFAVGGEGPTRTDWVSRQVARLEPGGAFAPLDSVPWLEVTVAPRTGADGTARISRNARMFGRTITLVGHGEGWIQADNGVPDLRFHTPTGDLYRIVRWTADSRAVTDEDVDRYLEDRLSVYEDLARRRQERESIEAHPDPPETMPAFGTVVRVDPDGNVWVSDYRLAYEDGPDRFTVFDAEGVWLGTVTMPDGLRVLEIGADHVLGLVTDELEIETVVMHGLVKPA